MFSCEEIEFMLSEYLADCCAVHDMGVACGVLCAENPAFACCALPLVSYLFGSYGVSWLLVIVLGAVWLTNSSQAAILPKPDNAAFPRWSASTACQAALLNAKKFLVFFQVEPHGC